MRPLLSLLLVLPLFAVASPYGVFPDIPAARRLAAELEVPPVGDGVPAAMPEGRGREPAAFSVLEPAGASKESAGFFRLREGRIAILPNGEDSLAARIQTLQKARRSIRIQALIFTGDESGLYISELLKKKKKELGDAIDIRIIVDAYSNLGWDTQWMYFDLKQHGIEVEGYETFYLQWVNDAPMPGDYAKYDILQANKRFHDKLWIIDGETEDAVAVVGGLNIANEYFRVDPGNPDGTWRDQDIIVKGEVVRDLVAAFERNYGDSVAIKRRRGPANTNIYWGWTRKAVKTLGAVKIPFWQDRSIKKRVRRYAARDLSGLRFEDAKCRFLHNRPRHGELHISDVYLRMIEDSRHEILIANAYFIPSAEMVSALKGAVRTYGAKAVLLSNSPETNDLPEITLVGRGSYHDMMSVNRAEPVTRLRARGVPAGMEIWEWQGRRQGEAERSQGTIHAKYAVFDQRACIVGSFNLDPRSDNLNSETVLVFESEPLARRLAKLFYENDLAYSRRLTMEDAAGFKTPKEAVTRLRKWFGNIFSEHL